MGDNPRRAVQLQILPDWRQHLKRGIAAPKSDVPHATTPPGRVTRRISAAAFSGFRNHVYSQQRNTGIERSRGVGETSCVTVLVCYGGV